MDQPSLPQVASGYIPAQILYVTVELGIADLLADGPRSYTELAEKTGTHPRTLRSLLRALVGQGVAIQVDADQFALTELGGQLRTGAAGSVREQIMLTTAPELWRAWGDLTTIVRSGEPSRQPGTGWTPLEWLLQDPEGSVKLHELSGQSTRALAPGIAEAADFTRFGRVADIGGGDGTLIAGILTAVPGLRGILYDLPSAVETAAPTLAEAGVTDRCQVIGGDFFESVPVGAEAYVLKYVIHDWNDDQVTTILRNCRAVMRGEDRLFIVETVVPPIMTKDNPIAVADLGVLVGCGGAERTEDEYRVLLEAGGFTLATVKNVLLGTEPSGLQVIEAAPAA